MIFVEDNDRPLPKLKGVSKQFTDSHRPEKANTQFWTWAIILLTQLPRLSWHQLVSLIPGGRTSRMGLMRLSHWRRGLDALEDGVSVMSYG